MLKNGTPASPAMARASRVLPVPGGPTSKQPLGIRPPSLVNFFGSFKKGDDFLKIVFRFFDAGHVGKRDAMLVLGQQLRPALAERHRLAAADLHLAHEKDPHADQQQHRKPIEQQNHVPRRIFFRLRGDLDFLVAQRFHQFRIVRRESSKALAVLVFALNVMALNENFLHVAAIHRAS